MEAILIPLSLLILGLQLRIESRVTKIETILKICFPQFKESESQGK